MANSKYAYVRSFERDDIALPSTYMMVRLDGKGFHRFSARHNFDKPNDRRALDLMNAAARKVMESEAGRDIVLAFGESDEFSFVFNRGCQLFDRRTSKITTTIVSTFTSFYVRLWPRYFPGEPLDPDEEGPSFDGRLVQYVQNSEVRDYLRWRQVDTHINNLYNTTFWCLVSKDGLSPAEATQKLSGTDSAAKNELLFQRGINYAHLDPLFRKGSLLARVPVVTESDGPVKQKGKAKRAKRELKLLHEDFIAEGWWSEPCHCDLLGP